MQSIYYFYWYFGNILYYYKTIYFQNININICVYKCECVFNEMFVIPEIIMLMTSVCI